MSDEIRRLQDRYDFLFDAYVRGMCDGTELEAAGIALRAAIQAAAPRHETGEG